MPSRFLAPTRALPIGSLLVLILGCGGDHLTQPEPVDTSQLYWALELNHHAVTLGTHAPYDTLPLAATARSAAGTALAGSGAPVYLSRDITKIVVTPEGVLHAVGATADPVWVVVTLTASGVTRRDSVRVRAVDVTDPPVLTTFSVQPIPPDSAKISANFAGALPVYATDDHGAPISDLMVAFRSSDELVARIDPLTGAIVMNEQPGHVTFSASATAFGVAKADSALYRIGAPVIAFLWLDQPAAAAGGAPEFRQLTIGVGAAVIWTNPPDAPPLSLEFDDAMLPNLAAATEFKLLDLSGMCPSADCNVGNVSTAPPDRPNAIRVFTAPGTYDYWCAPCGSGGRIVVVDESEP